MRYEVYAKKVNGRKWNQVGESNSQYDAIEMGANCGVNGYFAVYDTLKDEWVDLGFLSRVFPTQNLAARPRLSWPRIFIIPYPSQFVKRKVEKK